MSEASKRKKLAVVTGTTSGIGLVLTRMLLEAQWEVLGVARRGAPLSESGYHHLSLDLTDIEALQSQFAAAFEQGVGQNLAQVQYERVALVNNAALLGPVGPLEGLDAKELMQVMAVNTVAPVWLAGYLKRQVGATPLRVVDVSSGAAHRPLSSWGPIVPLRRRC